MKSDFSPSRRAWNVIMTAVVWAAAVLVIALTVGVIGLVLVRGIPHISWGFLSTTASILKGTDGILPAILNSVLCHPAHPAHRPSAGRGRGSLPHGVRLQPEAH